MDEDESSGVLIDLQIEESLGRETLMSIDSSNHMDDTITIAVYIVLLLLNIGVAYFGPNTSQTLRVTQKSQIHDMSTSWKASFSIESISTLNQYLILRITPIYEGTGPLSITVKSDAELRRGGTDVESITNTLPDVSFQKSNDTNHMVNVFTTRIEESSSCLAHVTFSGPELKRLQGCVGEWVYGDRGFAIIACIYRILFAFVIAVSSVMLHCKLKGTPFSMWHFEQKLCIGLLYLAIVMNNPLCPLLIWKSSDTLMFLDTVFHSGYVAYVKFFVIALFDSLRFKNRRISQCFFLPKLLFFGVYALAQIQYEYTRCVDVQSVRVGPKPWFDTAVVVVHWSLEVVFVCWIVFVCVRSRQEIDITEKFKFSVYVTVSAITLTIMCALEVLGQSIGFINISCYGFIIRISTENLFVVLMLTFHWPYELISDQYLVHNEKNNGDDLYGLDE